MIGARVFIDACVLYPPMVRALVLEAAAAGLMRPLWTVRVLDEWTLSVARKEPEAAHAAEAARRQMSARFPDALCLPAPEFELRLALPDPADAHVAAAAAQAAAALILTFNLRDFPARALAPFGLEARHPDGVFWELWSHAPERVEAVLRAVLPGLDPTARRGPLKRARLSRFGKAQADA
ncbi:MAG: RSP_2648 family PIN domain-containing protein [Pikeienuella sp.]